MPEKFNQNRVNFYFPDVKVLQKIKSEAEKIGRTPGYIIAKAVCEKYKMPFNPDGYYKKGVKK